MQGMLRYEPHALVGSLVAVIEQTIHEKLPKDFQRAETVLENGFIDAVVQRKELPTVLAQLVKFHQPQGGR